MDDLLKPINSATLTSKNVANSQFSEKGLYVNEDDQDWGSAGMYDIQKDTE